MFFPQLVLAAQLEGDPLPDPDTSTLQPPLRSPQIGHSTVAYNLYQFPNLTSDTSMSSPIQELKPTPQLSEHR